MFKSTKQKYISYLVFGVYFILLIWLVLFKFATSLSEIPYDFGRSINLIPFYYSEESSIHLKEVLYNIVVFIPLGVYIQIFKPDWKSVWKSLTVFLTSFLFELVQFVFAIGASDVTDLIGNTVGGVIGIYVCLVLKKLAPKKYISIFNTLGLIIEIMGISLMILLLVPHS